MKRVSPLLPTLAQLHYQAVPILQSAGMEAKELELTAKALRTQPEPKRVGAVVSAVVPDAPRTSERR
jgi:hypothetical protein